MGKSEGAIVTGVKQAGAVKDINDHLFGPVQTAVQTVGQFLTQIFPGDVGALRTILFF